MYYNYNNVGTVSPTTARRGMKGSIMELILINDKKLKIMLSEADMEKYHITGDELDYSKLKTRTLLKSILSDAKDATGFCTDGESFFVQLYTSAHGGCELFITKGSTDECAREKQNSAENTGKITRTSLYSFSSFHRLTLVCRRLLMQNDPADSTAYSDTSGTYYLMLRHAHDLPADRQGARVDRYTFIGEYGKPEDSECFKMYIGEYGCWVCKNAVSVLGAL